MNKTDVRNYPYFFVENFEISKSDTTIDWSKKRIEILKSILKENGILND